MPKFLVKEKMLDMNEQLYTLSDIPLEYAVLVELVPLDVDQRPLLSLMGRRQKYPRKKLKRLLHYAVSHNLIRHVKVRLHDGTIKTFVDNKAFPTEFSALLEKLGNNELGLSRRELRRILRGRRDYRRKVLRYILSIPVLLHIGEWFCLDIDAFINLTTISPFHSIQVQSEIRDFLNLLANNPPKDILEIGTCKGGTLYLLTKVVNSAATLVAVDTKVKNKKLVTSFARKKQDIIIIEANSTAARTIARIRDIFSEGIDCLFIDGDHSYDGVKKDFENYSPFVRPGGLIALHDIVESNASRYGVNTGGWVGGVPTFWQEIKPRFEHLEFIGHSQQDGKGIGVVFIA